MSLTKIDKVFYQGTAVSCGAAAAVNVLRVFGIVNVATDREYQAAQKEAFKKTKTTGVADWLGSTPSKVVGYVMDRLTEADVKFDAFIADDAVAEYRSMDGLINTALLSRLKDRISNIEGQFQTRNKFTDQDVIVRFLDIGGSVSGHFVVQTNFDDGGKDCQFLDSGDKNLIKRYQATTSFEAFLKANAYQNYKCTAINVGLTALG